MAAKSVEQWDANYVVPELNTIKDEWDGDQLERKGFVYTFYGYVSVYAIWWSDDTKNTRLEFIYNGRQYTRSISTLYQPRYLVTLAKRFAADVVGEVEGNG